MHWPSASEIGTAHAQYRVIYKYRVSGNHIFGIADPTMTMELCVRLYLCVCLFAR